MIEFYDNGVLNRRGPYQTWYKADEIRQALFSLLKQTPALTARITNISIVIDETLIGQIEEQD